jgi:tRNA(Ile)-lysidine synthase
MFDAAKIADGDMVARNFRRGDRINLIGMRGSRKVHDVFVDRKLPRAQRDRVPMITIAGRLAWIPGLARADCAIVTKSTETILRLEASKTERL